MIRHYFQISLKILFYSVLTYLILVVLEYARQGFINDLSLQKVDPDNSNQQKMPVYLVSYADSRENFYRNQNAMSHYAINKGIDFILNYRRNHISPDFIKDNKEIFDDSKGAGMWLWKPYIIMETMKKAPDGAIIIYLDAAFYIKKSLNGLIDMLGNNDVLLVHDRERKNGAFIKGDSFALMNCLNLECRMAPHIWGAALVIRNTATSRSFIEQWLKSSEDIRILSGKSYGIAPNYPEYAWHHFDQSVLSLVYHNNPKSVKMIEFEQTTAYLSWFHRKNSRSSPFKAWYTVYGTDPVVNFGTTGKTLPSSALLNFPGLVHLRKWFIENFM